jgi:hypothetical protein
MQEEPSSLMPISAAKYGSWPFLKRSLDGINAFFDGYDDCRLRSVCTQNMVENGW